MANFETALAGMRRGEKWRRAGWLSGSFVHVYDGAFLDQGGNRHSFTPIGLLGDNWEPYEEPKKSLTLEEAVRCEKVSILVPPETLGSSEPVVMHRYSGWTKAEVAFLHVAERRGWHMEEVE